MSRLGCCSRSDLTTPRIWLSALPCGRPSGSLTSNSVVWKNSLPLRFALAGLGQRNAVLRVQLGAATASASSSRLTWRALRATSLMPRLWLSSSSSVIIGRKTSCSSKRNRHSRVVHQHVGVEHEQPRRAGCAGWARLDGRHGAGTGAVGRAAGLVSQARRRHRRLAPASVPAPCRGRQGAAASVWRCGQRPGFRSRWQRAGRLWRRAAWAVAYRQRRRSKQKSRTVVCAAFS